MGWCVGVFFVKWSNVEIIICFGVELCLGVFF